MKPILTLLALLAVIPAHAAERPNVIVILADDRGSVDLGCYGAKDLHTPHTDALAARGVRFTQFYSAAPVCSPSRAGLLTGRWPVRAGVPNNCASQAGGKGALPPEEVTMAEMFQAAGYATAHIGKWHVGYRGAKFSLFEGGIRMPAIISWPGRLPQNEVRDQTGHACDWLPTLAELAGVKPPATKLDGRSLVKVLREAKAPGPHADHPLHWQVGAGPNADWAVRQGDWKLIGSTRDTTDGKQPVKVSLFLANLKTDPGEKTNLAERHPDIVARLRKLHQEHLD